MEEPSIFTLNYILSVLISVIAIAVNFYAYFSLKKTFILRNEMYIHYFSKAFLFFGISTLFGLLSFVTILLLAGIAGESPFFQFYVDVPDNLTFVAGMFYLVLAIKKSKSLRVV
jgi:hypothetical protein